MPPPLAERLQLMLPLARDRKGFTLFLGHVILTKIDSYLLRAGLVLA